MLIFYISTVCYQNLLKDHFSHQHSERGRPNVTVDLLHPLVADGAGGDDEGGTSGHGFHGHQAVRAIEGSSVKAFLFVVNTVCVLPQLTVHTLDTGLVVHKAQLATDALEAVARSVERDQGRSGGGFCLLLWIQLRSFSPFFREIFHPGRFMCIWLTFILRGCCGRIHQVIVPICFLIQIPLCLCFSLLWYRTVRRAQISFILCERVLKSGLCLLFCSSWKHLPGRALCVFWNLMKWTDKSEILQERNICSIKDS